MESGEINLKRTSSDLTTVDITRCIICQLDNGLATSSTQNGRKRVLESAEIREDIVNKRLKLIGQSHFSYHLSNECYKTYTMKKTLKNFKQSKCKTKDSTADASVPNLSYTTRSNIESRALPGESMKLYNKKCVICGCIKHCGVKDKYRISEAPMAQNFLKASLYFQDEVYVRTCDLQELSSVFGADLYYHGTCWKTYHMKYKRCVEKKNQPEKVSLKNQVFQTLMVEINPGLQAGNGYILSAIRDKANDIEPDDVAFCNKELKLLLCNYYGDKIMFSSPKQVNKSVMVFLKDKCVTEEMDDTLRNSDPLLECATSLRKLMLEFDFNLQDKFCDAYDMEESLNTLKIPDAWLKFFALLFNFDYNFFEKSSEKDNSDNFSNDQDDPLSNHYLSNSRRMKIIALFQVIYFIIHSGHKRTPLHIMNAQAIYNVCKSSTLLKSFNHLGLCVSYEEVLRYRFDMASFIVESCQQNVPLPSRFNPESFTTAAFDNFDHTEATLSGKDGSHDTVSVLYQSVPKQKQAKPNISDTNICHGPKLYVSELPCQNIIEFIKPARKPALPENYDVDEAIFVMDEENQRSIEKKDVAWSISRLNISCVQTEENEKAVVSEFCENQMMPSWSAFNSVVTDENLQVKQVGFIPLIPSPVTEYSTVYTALRNFQNVLTQLHQKSLPVTCDEGVYRIAREILLISPEEFQNIVLMLGSFHMIKVTLACLGKFIRGSGAETIWVENEIFGPNVVESVLNGTNYVRSLKGMLLLCDAMDRLRWASFFQEKGTEKYNTELKILHKLKTSVAGKNVDLSKIQLQDFADSSTELLLDFKGFIDFHKNRNQTFCYWNEFIELVSILKCLIRADREGDWLLHLHTVQLLMPLFAVFDRTNYLRWCSIYLEDMRKLETSHPEIYREFLHGNFVIKRTNGHFKAIGADMCLEQTINRSQKSSSGIIGSSKKKQYVAQWEMIYHEMLAVSNLHREFTGVNDYNYELKFNHEFTASQVTNDEKKVEAMMHFIKSHENPFTCNSQTSQLHNICTQEVLTEEIRKDLLNVRQDGLDLYEEFRKERFIDKTVRLSETIRRRNVKTFTSLHCQDKKTSKGSKKSILKESSYAQKQMDIGRERGMNMRELFKFDFMPNSSLFDMDGLMTKPAKSTLFPELEKKLNSDDYTKPETWENVPTAYIVDFMANIRKVKTTSLKTFGDLCNSFVNMILSWSKRASNIHIVYDSYIDGSIKDSERLRRSCKPAVTLAATDKNTSLPVDMKSFWGSNTNKIYLQKLMSAWLHQHSMTKCPNLKIHLSGTERDSAKLCHSVQQGQIEFHNELDVQAEEADVRLISHILYAVKSGIKRTVILSGDTDVFVVSLYHFETFKTKGLSELWLKAGVGDTTRYIPLHKLAKNLGSLCSVLPAVHALTGCDSTSKLGSKHAAVMANPVKYLQKFGDDPHEINIQSVFSYAESYLVQVLKKGTDIETFDELRYHLYHHSKSMTIDHLPPTSYAVQFLIQRAFYVTNILTMCLDRSTTLNPEDFGYEKLDDLLVPTMKTLPIPAEFSVYCNCVKCATTKCKCRKQEVFCCKFCNCRSISDNECKNPHVMLDVPFNMADT